MFIPIYICYLISMAKRTLHQDAKPQIFKNAEMLRSNMTVAEKIVWDVLKNKKLGVKFRRQHSLGRYVLDFYCHEIGLVIELDGKYHEIENQKVLDKDRDKALEISGLKVIRFKDEDVMERMDMVISKIKSCI